MAAEYSRRPHLWLRRHDRLLCPRGHHLHHNVALIEDECFICTHKADRAGAQCGERVYVLAFPGGPRFLTQITQAEFFRIRDEHMDVEQILEYLSRPLDPAA